VYFTVLGVLGELQSHQLGHTCFKVDWQSRLMEVWLTQLTVFLLKDIRIQCYCGGSVKSAYEPKWPIRPQAGAYSGFYNKKRLGVFLLLPGWNASPSQG